jgi:hypothetical protein
VAGRRHNVFWIAAALVVAIGGLAVANLLAFNPDDVKKEFEREFAQLPQDDVIRRDTLMHGMLANESYQNHAKAQYRDLERAHPRTHDAAQLEREAMKAVPPFLARCKDLSTAPADELRRLHDEAQTHLANYGGTRQAGPLREALNRVKERLEKQDKVGPKELLELQKAVHDHCRAGRIAGAKDAITAFRRRPGSNAYAVQLRELDETVRRKETGPTPR